MSPDSILLTVQFLNVSISVSDSNRVGMQFRVTLERGPGGFGFTTRSTYMGNESFARIKSVGVGGPAFNNGW